MGGNRVCAFVANGTDISRNPAPEIARRTAISKVNKATRTPHDQSDDFCSLESNKKNVCWDGDTPTRPGSSRWKTACAADRATEALGWTLSHLSRFKVYRTEVGHVSHR